MTDAYRHQKNRLIALILSTLVAFNTLVAFYIYTTQKDRLLLDTKTRTITEIQLIGGFLSDSILRNDYAESRNFLRKWAEGRPDLALLEVGFRGGKMLFTHGTQTLTDRLQIAECGSIAVGSRMLDIRLAYRNNHIADSLRLLAWLLVLFVAGLTLVVGAILWTVLSRWILRPMRHEIQARTEALERLNHSYRALSESNMALLTADSELQLLEKVCRILQSVCGYSLVWIGYAKEDDGHSIRIMSSHGDGRDYAGELQLCWSDAPCGMGPAGRSIKEKQAVVTNDIANDPEFEPWREKALKHGFKASAAFPIVFKDHAIGTIGLYAKHKSAFAGEEMRLISELAGNLAFGIMALRDRRRVAELSVTDQLTGLYNRRKLHEVISAETARFERYQTPYSLVIFDIDYFKSVNDRFGHPAGDAVLKEFAACLMKNRRSTDTIGRWGGEEFLAILSDTALPEALGFCERLKASVAQTDFTAAGRITFSAGVGTLAPGESAEALIGRVDAALYAAKGAGRDRIMQA
ncbi:MAG: diguanylate cyclase [Campylobacterales bacterium]